MRMHNESSLPRWARELINDLRVSNDDLIRECEQLRAAHAVLLGRSWFTVPAPEVDGDGPFRLWLLAGDNPMPVFSIEKGDVILVGKQLSELSVE
jgi:hypothetical protein